MPRHKARSHLSFDPIPSTTACGIVSPLVLTLGDFLNAENRCQRCDRIRLGLPPVGGRNKKETLKYAVVLSHLTPEAFDRLQRLAADGKVGETIGGEVNHNTEKLGRQ
jgi:hypothetical protein